MDYISFPKLGITINISKGFSIGSLNVRWYGVIICAGLLLCIFLGMRFAKKYMPKTDIHVSTQANIVIYEAVKFWRDFGATRAILGREVSIKDMA